MNRTLKRVLGLAGSVALGVTGALTFASAAQAHHSDVSGTPTCLPNGDWQVVWSVVEGDWHGKPSNLSAVIKEVKSDSDAELVGDFSLLTTADDNVQLPDPDLGEAPLEATQVLDASVESVKLKVTPKWNNNSNDHSEWRVVHKPNTGCEPEQVPETPAPGLSHSSDCFGIQVVATNENAEALSTFTFTTGSDGEPVTATPEVNEPFFYEFFVEDVEAGLTVTVVIDDGEPTEIVWEGVEDCPIIESTATCEGIEITLTVPEEGVETTFTFIPAEGDEQTLTLAPGESGTVFIPGVGTELEIFYEADTGKFIENHTITWTKPGDCDDVPPSEEPTTPAAQLPVTGSSMSIMISAAAALVVAAAVLFFVARRRRAAADW